MTKNGKSLPRLGFIGQGWIGRHLADHFENRKFPITRYALEPEYRENQAAIADCDIVFIAVPTPAATDGFDLSAIRSALSCVGAGKTAVIRSTVLPGTTDALAAEFEDRYVLHMPEFLREASVEFDIANPDRTVVGIPSQWRHDPKWNERAAEVLAIMPLSSQRVTHTVICAATEAEIIKHASNEFLCLKTVFMNLMYDALSAVGGSWEVVAEALVADPRIGPSHMYPVHQYEHLGDNPGRGAGGHCFPKDWTAFRRFYERKLPDDLRGINMLRSIEAKNLGLLLDSGKDLDILKGVYGENLEAASGLI